MFKIVCSDGRARTGIISHRGRRLETPAFAAVATSGFLKAIPPCAGRGLGIEALITNSIHHIIAGTVGQLGGLLHKIHGIWLFSDSGGFQIVRKGFEVRILEEGLAFPGMTITPKRSLEVQERLEVDAAFQLDYCPPYGASYGEAARSAELTLAWAREFLSGESTVLRYAIVQGGLYRDLRYRHARELAKLGPDGFGIGGLAVGEPPSLTHRIARATVQTLPEELPRHFLGLGTPLDVLEAVSYGVDTFDSAYPTRNARHGMVLSSRGYVDVSKARARRGEPVNPSLGPVGEIPLETLHSLYKKDFMAAVPLLTEINLRAMGRLMALAREAICKGELEELISAFRSSDPGAWEFY